MPSELAEEMPVEEIARPQTAEEREVSALDAFLSVDPQRPKETLRLHIQSLNSTITIRELDEVEIDDVMRRYDKQRNSATTINRNQNPAAKARRDIDINADMVAMALVDPNLRDETVLAKFQERFGEYSIAKILKRVMKPLELQTVAAKVLALSGADDEAVTEAGS